MAELQANIREAVELYLTEASAAESEASHDNGQVLEIVVDALPLCQAGSPFDDAAEKVDPRRDPADPESKAPADS
ncbi:MAG: hypothetical protein ACRDFS_13560, partial [Chloroflexota bacterium]